MLYRKMNYSILYNHLRNEEERVICTSFSFFFCIDVEGNYEKKKLKFD